MMNISNEQIKVAKNINGILKKLYANVSADGFNMDVDFFDIKNTALLDFGIYTSGFLGIQNIEEMKDEFTIREVEHILSGRFNLAVLTSDQALELLKDVKGDNNLSENDLSNKMDLVNVQDAKYYLKKNPDKSSKYSTYYDLILETEPLYFASKDEEDLRSFVPSIARKRNVDINQLLINVRNCLAHSTPFISGNRVVFVDKDESVIEVSKMWLMGYSELFAYKDNKINKNSLIEEITNIVNDNKMALSSSNEIYKVIYELKNYLNCDDTEINSRAMAFKSRMQLDNSFYGLELDEKINALATIIIKNQPIIKNGYGTKSASIIYNFQQKISEEMQRRKLDSNFSDDDIKLDELKELYKISQEMDARTKQLKNDMNSMDRDIYLMKLKKYRQDNLDNLNRCKELRNLLDNQKKLETSFMNLYNMQDLKQLPVEVAINIVYLMGYSNLTISGFYADLLEKTDFKNLNAKLKSFIDSIDMSNISLEMYNGSQNDVVPIVSTEQKCFALIGLRNAIIHGDIGYTYPRTEQNVQKKFEDVDLKFKAQYQHFNIVGKLKDIYNLFNQSAFTKTRDQEIITRDILSSPEMKFFSQENE